MKSRLSFFFILCSLFLQYCSNESYEQGRTAFLNENYSEAIELLAQADEQDKTTPEYAEMMTLAHMNRGHQLYRLSQNLDSFLGNYKEAQRFLPANGSPAFRKQYSALLCSLAEAILLQRNSGQAHSANRHKFAHEILSVALQMDSTNSTARDQIDLLNLKQYQSLLAKAQRLYKQGTRTDDVDLYFAARDYLRAAQKLGFEDKKVPALLSALNKKLLGVLDYKEGLSLAVTSFSHKGKDLVMLLAVKNYTSDSIEFDPAGLRLVDTRGREYSVDHKEMDFRKFYGEKCLALSRLTRRQPYTEGIVVFRVPSYARISYLSYSIDGAEKARKYFE